MKARRTEARLRIAAELLTSVGTTHWGYELSRRADVGAGSMYPFLSELLAQGYLEDGWEEERPSGRPARRYYRVTPSGERFLRDFLAASHAGGRHTVQARSVSLPRPVVER